MPTTGSAARAEGVGRSDVLMIARVNPDRTAATVVSIPRDSWVTIPGHGPDKINAAYAVGGAPLLVQTVEQLTALRIDHFGVVDFAGFQTIVDAVGGIDVGITQATSHDGVEFRQGSTISTACRHWPTCASASGCPVGTSTAASGSRTRCARS